MSVNRDYTIRISTLTDNPGARQTAEDLKDTGTAGKDAGEDLKVFETQVRELCELIRELNDALPGTGLLLRAAFAAKTADLAELLSAIERIKAGVRSGSPPESPPNQADAAPLEQEPTADIENATAWPQDDPSNANREYADPNVTNARAAQKQSSESAFDALTRGELAHEARQFQKAFQANAPAISQQDAVELLSVMRQLGEAFFEQSNSRVSKAEFKREMDGLRRLIETKGK